MADAYRDRVRTPCQLWPVIPVPLPQRDAQVANFCPGGCGKPGEKCDRLHAETDESRVEMSSARLMAILAGVASGVCSRGVLVVWGWKRCLLGWKRSGGCWAG